MELDLTKGTLKINDEVFLPKYSFEQFKKSAFYKGQDGKRIILLEGFYIMNGRKFLVSLFFRTNIIYMISLMCDDKEFTWENEKERKEFHDEILAEYSIIGKKEFPWGNISSNYDPRSGSSSIDIVYY